MKTIQITFIFVLLHTVSFCQNWQWARQIGSSNLPYHELASIISDGTNIFMIGSYGGQLFFPSDTLNCLGTDDIFIAKYDASGNFIWAKSIGGNFSLFSDYEHAFGVFDPACSCIYLTGTIIGNVSLDSIILSSSGSLADLFLAKMDLDGNFIWAKLIDGIGYKIYHNVYTNPFGKIYLVSQSEDSVHLDTFHLGPGGALFQFDPDGNCLSAEIKFSAPFTPVNYVALTFIEKDLIYYGGFRSSPFILDTLTLIPVGNLDAFIARADSNGNVKWIRTYGNSGVDLIQSIEIDSAHNLYTSGVFTDSVNLDGLPVINSGDDLLISKYDEAGNLMWAKQTYSSGSSIITGTKNISDIYGNSYITGSFSGTSSFGNFTISATTPNDMFVTRYNSNGDCLGVRSFGQAHGHSIATDNSGNIYCAGVFENSINIGGNSFTSLGSFDIYLAKIDAFTGIEEAERTKNELTIYANPSNGQCTIVIPDEFKNYKSLTLQIFDSIGRIIQQMDVDTNSDKIKMNLEASAKGIYQVILSNDKMSYHGKIVFE